MTSNDPSTTPARPFAPDAASPPPPFDIVGPDGRRLTVIPHGRSDTVRDLARALGRPATTDLTVDGCRVAPHEPLGRTPLRAGSTVSTRHPFDVPAAAAAEAGVDVVVATGPDCAPVRRLAPGRHVVGRARSAAICIDDPSVEQHHGIIDVAADGTATFLQLTGRIPATIATVPCHGATVIPPGVVLSVGGSGLVVAPARREVSSPRSGRLLPVPGDPWRRIVQRGRSEPAPHTPTPIERPPRYDDDPMPPATGLVGAGVAVLGAGCVAVLLGQMMFALFALIGALSSLATWVFGVVGTLRRRRRGRAADRTAHARFEAAAALARDVARADHIRVNPTVTDALDRLARVATTDRCAGLWERRVIADGGPMRIVVGRGALPWAPPIDAEAHDPEPVDSGPVGLPDVPLPVDLTGGTTIAVRGGGDPPAGIVRSAIVQLATHSGPADWRLVVVARSPDRWQWVTWLPHAMAGTGRAGVIDPDDSGALAAGLDASGDRDGRPVVLVVEAVELFAIRTGHVRRFIDVARPSTIAILRDTDAVPAMCELVVDVSSTGSASIRGAHTAAADIDAGWFASSGISVATADRAARVLAAMVDPEDESAAVSSIASAVTLAEVDAVIAGVHTDDGPRRVAISAVASRWAAAGSDPAPRAVIGRSADGAVEIDLVRDGPHALIAGTTGAGKSELLRTLVVALALRCGPDQLTFVLVDYKGGSTFDACAELPHTVGLVTDLDGGLAERALTSLEAELHRRERLLRAAAATDLSDYRSRPDHEVLPRLVVVIDEFAALAQELPDFLAALVGIAQRGRSLGLHLVLATQRPAGVVNDDIRANTNLRLALRLNDVADAHDVVADGAPAGFPRRLPGRAALRLGPDELVTFQTASCSAPAERHAGRLGVTPHDLAAGSAAHDRAPADRPNDRPPSGPMSQLEVAVAVVGAAARQAGTAPPHRPWIAPLPADLTRTDVDLTGLGAAVTDAIGLVDDPAGQCRRPLRRAPADGNLAVIGSLGSGTTTTLLALLAAACRTHDPGDLHCYVIDACDDERYAAFAEVAHCGALVRTGDVERLHRLLARLVERIEAGPRSGATAVLAIDGLASLRTALGSVERAETLALLDRVLGDGPSAGVVGWWCDDGIVASATARAADTWILHLDDAAAAGAHGTGRVAAVDDIAGRLRIASSGLIGQVAADAGDLAALPARAAGRGPAPIERLPERVAASTVLVRRPTRDRAADDVATGAAIDLPVGLSECDLSVATLRVPARDHVFVGGAAATGKSNALEQLGTAWQRWHPTGVRIAVDRRHPLTADRLAASAGRPVLVVVDDAERVDDVDGTIGAIIADAHAGVTIAAAARLDAVRAGYGHWTRDVARSRCGLILTSPGDVDGDLLGVVLPRRHLIAPRPGLGWLVDTRGHRLVQIAQTDDQAGGVDATSPSSQRGPVPKSRAVSAGL